VYEFGLTSRSPAHRNGVSSGVHQWKVGDNGETKQQLEERKKGRISIMASDGRMMEATHKFWGEKEMVGPIMRVDVVLCRQQTKYNYLNGARRFNLSHDKNNQ
jgi:hypothetical protein